MDILDEVEEELGRAFDKFPLWPTDPLHALAVLAYEPHKTSRDEIRKEAIQTAAMALRLAASLGVYEYRRSTQHLQGKLGGKLWRALIACIVGAIIGWTLSRWL